MRVCLPTDAAGKYVVRRSASKNVDGPPATDPRFVRSLPWDTQYGIGTHFPAFSFCGLALVVMPGWFFYHMLRDRRWNLRTWLALPLVVAGMILAYRMILQMDSIRTLSSPGMGVFAASLEGVAFLVFPALTLIWSIQRQWRRVGLLGTLWLAITVIVTTVMFSEAAGRLDVREQIAWTWRGFENVLVPTSGMAGWTALVVMFVAWCVRRIRQSTGTVGQ